MIQNILDQGTNILSGKSKDLESTTTGGSAAGEAAGQWGLDQYKNMMERGVNEYGGPIVGAQGSNAAQNQQYNMLTGMQTGYGGPAGYQGKLTDIMGRNAQQLGPMSRSGGPGAYAGNRNKLLEDAARKRYTEALAMGNNQIGAGAEGANAFGGSRHAMASGAMGAKAMQDYMQQTGQLYADSYDKGMNWMGQDQNRNIAIANANNQANLGFGAMNMAAGQNNINNLSNISDRFGRYGLNEQNQKNIADSMRYREFGRQEDWMPNMMNNYMAGVRGTPWQTSQTQYGSGPSDLQNIFGAAVGLGGAYLMG